MPVLSRQAIETMLETLVPGLVGMSWKAARLCCPVQVYEGLTGQRCGPSPVLCPVLVEDGQLFIRVQSDGRTVQELLPELVREREILPRFGQKSQFPTGRFVDVVRQSQGKGTSPCFLRAAVIASFPHHSTDAVKFRRTGRVAWIREKGGHIYRQRGQTDQVHPVVSEYFRNRFCRAAAEKFEVAPGDACRGNIRAAIQGEHVLFELCKGHGFHAVPPKLSRGVQ